MSTSRDLHQHYPECTACKEVDAAIATLRDLAAAGLKAFHGRLCSMRGTHPSNPAECEDPHCRKWAATVMEGI